MHTASRHRPRGRETPMITNTHPLDYSRTVTVTPEQHDQFLWLRLAVDTERDLGREQYAALSPYSGWLRSVTASGMRGCGNIWC